MKSITAYITLNIFLFGMMALTISSCATRQEIVYFQDEIITSEFKQVNAPEITFKPSDLLTIDVSALEPEAVRPFNLPAVAYNTSIADARGTLRMQTYLIDVEGNIQFPVLGNVKLAGLTRTQATKMLRTQIAEYVKNPIVNIRLINFTVTVLGEVKSPGTFTIEDERISLTEALGLAGDLTIYGRRDNVVLIREIDGEKRYAKIDLTSVNSVNSSNYYLTQNDVIYVEPNTSRVRSSRYTQNNSVIISAVGTLATIIAILIK